MKAVHLLLAFIVQTCSALSASPDAKTDVAGEARSADKCFTQCNNFTDICLPESADPANAFQPHCEGSNDVRRPSIQCLLCLKQHGVPRGPDQVTPKQLTEATNLTETITKQPLPSLQTNTTEIAAQVNATVPSTPSEHANTASTKPPSPSTTAQAQSSTARPICSLPPASTADPCRAFCDNYDHICMPSEADPCFTFYPHCDSQLPGYRKASEKCLKCTGVNGVRPNPLEPMAASPPTATLPWDCWCSRVQTIVTEESVKKCPKFSRECVFSSEGAVIAEEWSCGCGTPVHVSKLAGSSVEGRGGNCASGSEGRCKCRRTERATKQVEAESCEGFAANHGLCDVDSTSAYEHTTVSNECACEDCNESDDYSYYSYLEDYFDI